MKLDESDFPFEPWLKWEDRGRQPLDPSKGGLYLWGHFRNGPPSDPPLAEGLPVEVIYVGNAKDLRQRPLTGHHKVQR